MRESASSKRGRERWRRRHTKTGRPGAVLAPTPRWVASYEATVGDAEFVVELIGDFLDGLPGQLAALGALRATTATARR